MPSGIAGKRPYIAPELRSDTSASFKRMVFRADSTCLLETVDAIQALKLHVAKDTCSFSFKEEKWLYPRLSCRTTGNSRKDAAASPESVYRG